ncbi:hypothetical protein [Paludisphaera soli]|uniref:hypothetical protein n=1 Tax=Paludisphaera soli TaxID=2712865 RepID=UPI0013EDB8B0|nr:hypothetical protein [Paludisphaera soli]
MSSIVLPPRRNSWLTTSDLLIFAAGTAAALGLLRATPGGLRGWVGPSLAALVLPLPFFALLGGRELLRLRRFVRDRRARAEAALGDGEFPSTLFRGGYTGRAYDGVVRVLASALGVAWLVIAALAVSAPRQSVPILLGLLVFCTCVLVVIVLLSLLDRAFGRILAIGGGLAAVYAVSWHLLPWALAWS